MPEAPDDLQARLVESASEMASEMFERALLVLQEEREQYGRELRELKAELALREKGEGDGSEGQP